ncbi:hypothetical protein AVEN_187960-1, partial [Araneus ventricosus]
MSTFGIKSHPMIPYSSLQAL